MIMRSPQLTCFGLWPGIATTTCKLGIDVRDWRMTDYCIPSWMDHELGSTSICHSIIITAEFNQISIIVGMGIDL
jgi:hypothetical protein